MCLPLTFYSWPLWWPLYLLCLATTTVSKLSAVALPLPCKTPSPSLISLHVRTLRLNPNAGRPQPYVMRGCKLTVVPQSSGGN